MASDIEKFINEMLVETFNSIMKLEQGALCGTRFNNLTITEVHTIHAIGPKGSKTMSEIANELDITVATLTKAITKLAQKGYVVRRRTEEDRRVVLISLTKKGVIVYRIHNLYHAKMIRETFGEMTEQEKDVLAKGLRKLNEFFKKEAEAVLQLKKDTGKFLPNGG